MPDGLRILTRIIARAHLRRRLGKSSTTALGPPLDGKGEQAKSIPELGEDA